MEGGGIKNGLYNICDYIISSVIGTACFLRLQSYQRAFASLIVCKKKCGLSILPIR